MRGSFRRRLLVALATVPLGLASTVTLASPAPALGSGALVAASAAVPRVTGGTGARPGRIALTRDVLPRFAAQSPAAVLKTVPPSVDLTAWTVPAGNQGQVNSCTTWAIGHGLLGWYSRRQSHAGQPFAPMYLYSQVQARYHWKDYGSSLDDVGDLLVSQGIDTVAHYGGSSTDWRRLPTKAERKAAAAHITTSWRHVIDTWPKAPGTAARAALSETLASGHPAVIAIPVYKSFYDLDDRSVYEPGGSGDGYLGGHAMLAVGYDTEGLLVQNSWGRAWGDDGFARLSWDYVEDDLWEAIDFTGGFADIAASAPATATAFPVAGPLAGGTTVTIRGSRFTGAAAVRFGETPAASFTVVDDDTVTAVAPAGSGSVTVTVTDADGVAASPSTARFRYLAAPTLTRVSGGSGSRSGGATVTLSGSGFVSGMTVGFGGTPGTRVTVRSATSATVRTPAHSSGAVTVSVTTPGGSASRSRAYTFVSKPSVTGVSPSVRSVRGGHAVTLTGSNFAPGMTVDFGGSAARSVDVRSSTRAVVRTPRHAAGKVSVTVRTSGGSATRSGSFRFAR